MRNKTHYICSLEQFAQLFEQLKWQHYKLLGPTVKNDVVVYDQIDTPQDLPQGFYDEQNPGYYRLKRGELPTYFHFHASPQSWKKFLFPSSETLWSVKQEKGKIVGFEEPYPEPEKLAFIGVLGCDLQAMFVLDRVYDRKIAIYEQYHRRRENSFILAINCTSSVNTCFCTSMGTGPDAKAGYDLSLTEICDQNRHYFLLRVGSEKGEQLCHQLALKSASSEMIDEATALVQAAAEGMKRHVDTDQLQELLAKSLYYKRWNQVAERCINCANCTMACPTCFCSNAHDELSLDGSVIRTQSWESCFNLSHSYVHGGPVRHSGMSRYRQWLTHKFGTWWDQFGLSGCVGCGRCITWCPVGIDVTEELAAIKSESYEEPC